MILYCKLQDDAAWVWWVRLREVVLEDRECDNLASDTVDDSPRILPRTPENNPPSVRVGVSSRIRPLMECPQMGKHNVEVCPCVYD